MNKNANQNAIKAGLWYTACNFILRAINFLTTPLFARLMSKSEYGDYSNFSTWLSLLLMLSTMDLYVSIVKARIDYEKEIDEYVASIQILGTIFGLVSYLVVMVFHGWFSVFFHMEQKYIHAMFVYFLFAPAVQLLQTKEQQLMRYKKVVVITAISTLTGVGCSVVLVLTLQDKLWARVLGSTLVPLVLSVIVYIYNICLGKRITAKYWSYAVKISLPYIPHQLAANVLGQIDRIFITYYQSSEATAIYSISYSCSLVVTMVANSINQAWSPWLYDRLKNGEYKDIKEATVKYLEVAVYAVFLMMLIGPETIMIFGGNRYRDAGILIPLVMGGCYYVLMYTFYVNIEIYYSKTGRISVATMIAAIFNLASNCFFVPRYGYIAAGVTTLCSYIVLLVSHMFMSSGLKTERYYDRRIFFLFSALILGLALISEISYTNMIFRFCLLGITLLIFFIRNKAMLFQLYHILKGGQE